MCTSLFGLAAILSLSSFAVLNVLFELELTVNKQSEKARKNEKSVEEKNSGHSLVGVEVTT